MADVLLQPSKTEGFGMPKQPDPSPNPNPNPNLDLYPSPNPNLHPNPNPNLALTLALTLSRHAGARGAAPRHARHHDALRRDGGLHTLRCERTAPAAARPHAQTRRPGSGRAGQRAAGLRRPRACARRPLPCLWKSYGRSRAVAQPLNPLASPRQAPPHTGFGRAGTPPASATQ